MKEEHKYYQPDISEFHVGFEFEEELCGKWYKEIFDSDNDILGNRECQTKLSEIHYGNLKVRVKWLDEEDIESLGCKMDEWFIPSCGGTYRIKCSTPFDVPFERKITIETKNHVRDGSGRYDVKLVVSRARIKNKTEFKKLLQQLNIIV